MRSPGEILRRHLNSAAPLVRDGVGVFGQNSNGRQISYIFSDQSVARDKHIILTGGIDLKAFLRNPIFLWAHDTSEPPIGKVIDIGPRGTQLIGTVEYAERDVYPFADMIYRLVKEGFLSATSISWLPLEQKYTADKSRPGGIDFIKSEMLEVSQTPLPALSTALVTARTKKNIDISPAYDWAGRMLDRGSTILPRSELEVLRREAKMPARPRRIESSADQIAKADRIVRADRIASLVNPSLTRQSSSGFGEFLRDVVRAADGGQPASHLIRAANEGDPTSGGFLVGPQWSDDLIYSAFEESVIAPLVDRRKTSHQRAEVKIAGIDETSRQDGSRSGGSISYWDAESSSVPTSFPRTKLVEFTGKKIFIVTRASRELLNDVPMLASYINKGFAMEAGFKLDAAILSGTGVGQPLGILNSPALITVAKATGQAPATIVSENVKSMWSRLPAPCRRRAVWLCNEDAEGELENIGAASGQALYMPAGTGGNPFPLLKGRPVLVVEQSPILGAVGDIAVVDPSQYILIDGEIKSALSVHARFDNDEVVFRFTWRVDGKGAYSSAITPYNGSGTRSPFVALGAR